MSAFFKKYGKKLRIVIFLWLHLILSDIRLLKLNIQTSF